MRKFFLFGSQDDRESAVARLKERGVLVLPVAQDDPRLDISFHLVTDEVKDADLEPLAAFGPDDVYQVNLRGTMITDAGLAHLSKLTGLERLHLERTKVTDAGLAHLKDLKQVAYLNLYGAEAITDAAAEHLTELRGLKKLYLWQTKVTDDGQAVIQAGLPECKIDRGVKVEKKDGQQGDGQQGGG